MSFRARLSLTWLESRDVPSGTGVLFPPAPYPTSGEPVAPVSGDPLAPPPVYTGGDTSGTSPGDAGGPAPWGSGTSEAPTPPPLPPMP